MYIYLCMHTYEYIWGHVWVIHSHMQSLVTILEKKNESRHTHPCLLKVAREVPIPHLSWRCTMSCTESPRYELQMWLLHRH